MTLFPIPAFNDNYIWALSDPQRALVVDPGDALPVLHFLQQHQLTLDAILITHHHADHTGGVAALREYTGARVYGPSLDPVPEPLERLADGQEITILGMRLQVLHVPGHTQGHLAYFGEMPAGQPVLFCGDTLFSAGCGRLFEGTPAQMLASLTRLAALPHDTLVCCAHEYTQSSLRFACIVEPDNADLLSYTEQVRLLRTQNLPSLPSSIGMEKAINPFLRTHLPAVAGALRRFDPGACDPVGAFAALRAWKDQF